MVVDIKEYLAGLAERYSAFYDVERNKSLAGRDLAIFARSKIRNEKYFVTKSIPIYGYENYQYGLVEVQEGLVGKEKIKDFCKYLKSLVTELVEPHSEHMCTYLDGVIVSGTGFTPEAIAAGQGFKYGRMFKLGFRGWCDIRLLMVDLAKGQVFANRKGKELRDYFFPDKVCQE